MIKNRTKHYSTDCVMAEMGIDIAVNAAGQILILHDKIFSTSVERVEYHRDGGLMMFVMGDGSIRDFGMPAPKTARPKMSLADTAMLLLVENGKIADCRPVPVQQF